MKTVSPLQGLVWLRDGARILARQSLRLLLIGLVLQLLTAFSQAGPLGLLFLLAVPALVAGVLQAMHLVSGGMVPPVIVLFIAFQSGPRLLRLFLVGLLMLMAGFIAAGGLLSGALESLDPELLRRLEQGELQALQAADPATVQRLALSILAGFLLGGAIGFFGIPLVWFSGYPVGRAVVSGLLAILRNILAFIVMMAGLFLLAMPLGMLVVSMWGAGGGSALMTLLVLLLVVAYQVLIYGAQYAAFRDLFGVPGTAPRDSLPEDQLVA